MVKILSLTPLKKLTNNFKCKFMTDELICHIKKLKSERAIVSIRKDKIILVEIKSNDEVELEHAEQIIKGIEELSGGKKHPVLILVDKFTLPTSEVREYLALPETALYTSAEAYVLTSFSQKLAGNIYLSFNKPARPTKFFNSEDKAVEWLKTFL